MPLGIYTHIHLFCCDHDHLLQLRHFLLARSAKHCRKYLISLQQNFCLLIDTNFTLFNGCVCGAAFACVQSGYKSASICKVAEYNDVPTFLHHRV